MVRCLEDVLFDWTPGCNQQTRALFKLEDGWVSFLSLSQTLCVRIFVAPRSFFFPRYMSRYFVKQPESMIPKNPRGKPTKN